MYVPISLFLFQSLDWRLCQPRNTLSPSVISPAVGDLEENPFEAEFNAEYADGKEPEEEDDELDFISPIPEPAANFAILNSSLPE